MTTPRRYLFRMTVFLIAALAGVGVLFGKLAPAFMANPLLNGLIVGVLFIGVLYVFRQVVMLGPEVAWIETYRTQRPGMSVQAAPRLLAPMAQMIGERQGRLSLSAIAMRSLLDGIAARLDEARDISRYMIGLLIFLGLLGTFWGLLETVRSVAQVIGGLQISGADTVSMFADLKRGLEAPLDGMGTAFSTSLFGLAGSLILGFLDLQASQAANRFFGDLEDWLSSVTRLGGGGPLVEGGDQSVPAYIQALLETTADSLDNLQRTIAQGEASREQANQGVVALSERLTTLTDQMKTEQDLLVQLARNQMELKPVLERLAGDGSGGMDEATRNHIRNLDRYLARMVEESANGRTQAVQEIRSEIRLLARTIAALAEEPGAGPPPGH